MLGCAILEHWIGKWGRVDDDRLQNLAQFSVDFGDRRVFAGVHYPTDSIVSWIIALQLIPELFPANPARYFDFVVDAITTRSRLFATISGHKIVTDPGMQSSLALLDKAVKAGPRNQASVLT